MNDEKALYPLAVAVGQSLSRSGLMLATAESCTGGWLSQCITDVPGSSAWFDRGFVTYSNRSKCELLGVDFEILERSGAVSEQAVLAMASGALQRSGAQVSVAVTGVAGPSGGSPEKPIGTVWFAWQRAGCAAVSRCAHFFGERREIRRQAVLFALRGLLDVCESERR